MGKNLETLTKSSLYQQKSTLNNKLKALHEVKGFLDYYDLNQLEKVEKILDSQLKEIDIYLDKMQQNNKKDNTINEKRYTYHK